MSRCSRQIVLTTAVVPLAVLIGLRSAWANYVCSMTGEVAASRCCPAKSPDRSSDEQPRLETAACCDLEIAELAAPLDIKEGERAHQLEAPPIVLAAAVAIPAPRRGVELAHDAHARPPPPSSIPTYLANCSILR